MARSPAPRPRGGGEGGRGSKRSGRQAEEGARKIAKSFQGTGSNGSDGAKGDTGATGPQGPQGVQGPEGSPWTDGGTLPEGATETGTWAVGAISTAASPGTTPVYGSISFAIPLPADLEPASYPACAEATPPDCAEVSEVHFINSEGKEVTPSAPLGEGLVENPPHCPGSSANPQADPGHLCVYSSPLAGTGNIGTNAFNSNPIVKPTGSSTSNAGASTAGARVQFSSVENKFRASGTFAVTGPEEP